MSKGYGQYCPLAKASEIIAERWTPLVLREILMGERTFNDILRGVPLMSRSLLAKRLRDLARAGLIERRTDGSRRTTTYHPSQAAEELLPVLMELGEWAMRWARAELSAAERDPRFLMWDMRRRINAAQLPGRRVVVQFDFTDVPRQTLKRTWLVLSPNADVDVCFKDPGYPVDLLVTVSIRAMILIWMGDLPWSRAMRSGQLRIDGPRDLASRLSSWFLLSPLAGAERPAYTG